MDQNHCQIHDVERIGEPMAIERVVRPPLHRRWKQVVKSRLSPKMKRRMKRWLKKIIDFQINLLQSLMRDSTNRPIHPAAELKLISDSDGLQAGDLVRVRSRQEIEATLDIWRTLKGCSVMGEMWAYCGTTQQVYKPVHRFLEERDFRFYKATGVVLLEGLICQGKPFESQGGCDRSCFFFWREEWLEKLED